MSGAAVRDQPAASPAGPAGPTVARPSSRGSTAARLPWLAGAGLVLCSVTTFPFRDPDVWWHLAVGRLIVSHGIPSSEPFSFAGAPNPWVGQQWLYEWGLARVVGAGGPGLAMVVMGLAASLAFLLAALATRAGERIPGPAGAGAMIVGGLVAAEVLGVRGQVVTVTGTAATLLIVTRWRDGSRRAVWALPPLLLVWANLHAGFVTGLAVAGVAAAVVALRRRRGGSEPASVGSLLGATAVAALATLVNPAGPRLYGYVASTFLNPTLTAGITEWQSPDFHSLWPRVMELVAIALVLLWAISRRPDPLDVVLAVGSLAATLQSHRNVAILAVVVTPQLARYGTLAARELRGEPAPRRPLPSPLAWVCAVAAGAATFAGVVLPAAGSSQTSRYEREHDPAAAATWVAAHLPGERLYSTYEWGGYLAYRLPSPRVVWIYGESAIFGDRRLRDYLVVHDLERGWPEMLARNGMGHAVLPVEARETTAMLEVGWRALCLDHGGDAVVLEAPPELLRPGSGAAPPTLAGAPDC